MTTSEPSSVRQPSLVAVIDDDPTARRLMRFWLERDGYRVVEFDGGLRAISDQGPIPDVACVDLGLGDVSGLKLIEHLKARDPELPMIVVTAQRELETAVKAMRAGAYDYVTKPLERERLVHAVNRARERRELLSSVHRLESALMGEIVGRSSRMRELAQQISRVVDSEVAVCLFGESGTGKELAARAIHAGGSRRRGPFIPINCAAIAESLQESELFGHERGAFTGATQLRRGRFEQAHGGTLFLDEVGEMSPATQASLLRTLQEKTIVRVGGSSEIPIDVRIIAATHRDLRAEVLAGRFREDLYFRLVVYPVQLPPLRERREDIPLLVGHFLRTLRKDVGRDVTHVRPDALSALLAYSWPGNVRELQNVVHRSMLACRGDEITLADLPPELRALVLPTLPPASARAGASERPGGVVPLRELERRAIEHALRTTRGSVGQAAKLLGIGRATLYRRLSAFAISPGPS